MISKIYVYSEPRCDGIDFGEVATHLSEKLPAADVELRSPLLEGNCEEPAVLDALAQSLAGAKVRDLTRHHESPAALLSGEIAYERRRLSNRGSQVYGLLYDAHLFSEICLGLMSPDETGLHQVHVVFTNQLIGTWEPADSRFHARTVLCGSPAIVSIPGLVEAPAKSPGYYLARRGAEAFGLAEEAKMELAGTFADDCLSLDDPRLTEVAKGYAMQAVIYRLSGEAFCGDPQCRLFNAHWQLELLEAQTRGDYEYCREHEEFFRRFDKDGTA